MKRKLKNPKVGQKIYVPDAMYISHGSDDFAGGIATVSRVYEHSNDDTYVDIKERPGHGYNWTGFIGPDQAKLKEEYKGRIAHADPDIDTPWD
jgi:hypothetical protein